MLQREGNDFYVWQNKPIKQSSNRYAGWIAVLFSFLIITGLAITFPNSFNSPTLNRQEQGVGGGGFEARKSSPISELRDLIHTLSSKLLDK